MHVHVLLYCSQKSYLSRSLVHCAQQQQQQQHQLTFMVLHNLQLCQNRPSCCCLCLLLLLLLLLLLSLHICRSSQEPARALAPFVCEYVCMFGVFCCLLQKICAKQHVIGQNELSCTTRARKTQLSPFVPIFLEPPPLFHQAAPVKWFQHYFRDDKIRIALISVADASARAKVRRF